MTRPTNLLTKSKSALFDIMFDPKILQFALSLLGVSEITASTDTPFARLVLDVTDRKGKNKRIELTLQQIIDIVQNQKQAARTADRQKNPAYIDVLTDLPNPYVPEASNA